jgi:hypothetical protein
MNRNHDIPAPPTTGSAKPGRPHNASKINRQARLVIEANCTRCARMRGACKDPWLAARRATAHAARTGHIVILNGTADLPDAER